MTRRKVVQWGIVYVAGAWGFLQGLEYLSGTYDWPRQIQQLVTLALLIGLPIVLVCRALRPVKIIVVGQATDPDAVSMAYPAEMPPRPGGWPASAAHFVMAPRSRGNAYC